MDDETSKHECKDLGAMSCPANKSAHDRRASTFSGANALTTNLKEQQPSLTRSDDNAASPEARQTLGLPCTPESESAPSTPFSTPPSVPISSHTADEIDALLREIIRSKLDRAAVDAYFDADEKPPITSESLAELDMPRIINNPKLRHDVNFDRELHFRPNLDGTKGKLKLKQAQQYWKALEVELFLYNYVSVRTKEDAASGADWDRALKQSLRRLEGIFKAIREIMKTLVPDYDQKAVDERLDVGHVMQQIQNGVCDLIDLANWLAKILKRHCAPMRDALVDEMRREIESGVHANQNARLVEGLRQLMTILEAMKLDVANHQIRHMRPLLIDDTIQFQRRYNQHRITLEKIKPQDSKCWLENELETPFFTETDELTHLDAYCSALVRDVVFNSDEHMCPPAFYLDADRLQALRIEMHSMTYHELCRDVFHELAAPTLSPTQIASAYETLHGSIAAIVGTRGKFAERTENIAAEMARVLSPPPFEDDLLNDAESKLKDRLRLDSDSFRRTARNICQRILPKLRLRVKDLVNKSAMTLHNELVPLSIPRPPVLGFGAICEPVPVLPFHPVDPDDDLVRRMAHMLTLHWKVWWDLVYLIEDQPQDSDTESSDAPNNASATSCANTRPVAHAVYAPGRKWLPVGVRMAEVPHQLPTPAPSPPPPEEGSGHPPPPPPPSSSSSAASSSDADERNADDTSSVDPKPSQQQA